MLYKVVRVVPHSTSWAEKFTREAEQISLALGENLAAIYHIGSTAIPGIYAKPVIDMLVSVESISQG